MVTFAVGSVNGSDSFEPARRLVVLLTALLDELAPSRTFRPDLYEEPVTASTRLRWRLRLLFEQSYVGRIDVLCDDILAAVRLAEAVGPAPSNVPGLGDLVEQVGHWRGIVRRVDAEGTAIADAASVGMSRQQQRDVLVGVVDLLDPPSSCGQLDDLRRAISAVRRSLEEHLCRQTRMETAPPSSEPAEAPVAAVAPVVAPVAPVVPPVPAHSEDFASVNWYGTVFNFNETQARCIERLWQAWEQGGLSLNQRTIGDAIDSRSDCFRLAHTFRDHPAWEVMIQKSGEGRFRLGRSKM